jgi:hypothetical protein
MKPGAIIFTVMLLAGSPAKAGFFTGEQLLVKCNSEEVVHQLACVFYLAGAVDASQTHHKWGDISQQFCMDPGVNIVNLRQVYLRYAVDHVDELQLPATGTALNSFIDAFPCG